MMNLANLKTGKAFGIELRGNDAAWPRYFRSILDWE